MEIKIACNAALLAFSRETERVGVTYMLEDLFKELAHAVVEAGKPEMCRADQQAGNSDRS